MKTQTQVLIQLDSLQPFENLHIQSVGYVLKFFMACSQIYSKSFTIRDSHTELHQQKLKIKNILGDQLQVWLCTTENKIIANNSVTLIKQGDQELQLELKLNNISFVKLNCHLNITKRQIQKLVYVEPDQQLLKKQEDPQTARLREQLQKRKLKQQQEFQKLAQKQKKHAITTTHRNKKDQPFL